MNEFILF